MLVLCHFRNKPLLQLGHTEMSNVCALVHIVHFRNKMTFQQCFLNLIKSHVLGCLFRTSMVLDSIRYQRSSF